MPLRRESDDKLFSSYEKIGSTKITERTAGTNELKRILQDRRHVRGLTDKGFHKMYEALFGLAMKERGGMQKVTKTKATAAARLANVGSCFRAAVEAGVGVLKGRTVRAVYKHIMDMLRTDEGLFEPLAFDYCKALRVCLSWPPHVEHLGQEDWEMLMDFCCQFVDIQLGINNNFEGDADEEDDGELEEMRSPEVSVMALGRDKSKSGFRKKSSQVKLKHDTEELMGCLNLLLKATNAPLLVGAPILSNAATIVNTLLGFLDSQNTVTRAHQTAFASLNLVLSAVMTNSIALCERISLSILKVISRLWYSAKAPAVREELVITLIYCQRCIRKNMSTIDTRERFRGLVENMLDKLLYDYSIRPERDILQLEDLSFPDPLATRHEPLSVQAFELRNNIDSFKAEQVWMVPALIASFIEMLDSIKTEEPERDVRERDPNATPKRQKRSVARSSELMRRVRGGDSQVKLCSLQVFPFLAALNGVNEDLSDVLKSLFEACVDDQPVLTSWAMLALASCAYMRTADDVDLAHRWKQIWQLAMRYSSSPSTCRAACQLLRVVLCKGLIKYAHISKDIDAIIVAIDLSGPSLAVDSSLALWAEILKKRNTVVHSSSFLAGERLFQWFTSKWRIGDDGMDKATAGSYATTLQPTDVTTFLLACCEVKPKQVERADNDYPVCGPISHAVIRVAQCSDLLNFLLIEGNEFEFGNRVQDALPHVADDRTGIRRPELERQVIELLSKKATIILEKWQVKIATQLQNISADVFLNYVGFLYIASTMTILLDDQTQQRQQYELKLTSTLFKELKEYIVRKECSQKQLDALLSCTSRMLPTVKEVLHLEDQSHTDPLGMLYQDISHAFKEKEESIDDDEDDMMDLDEEFSMPANARESENKKESLIVREDLQALCSAEALRSSTCAHLKLYTISAGTQDVPERCAQFAEYLQGLPRSRLVMARPIIRDFVESCSDIILVEDYFDFAGYLAESLLQGYEYERCECSTQLCIEVVRPLTARWAHKGCNDDMAAVGDSVLTHVTKLAMDKQILSHGIRMTLVLLLEDVLSVNREYKTDDDLSVEKFFIGLLKDEDIRVLYTVGSRMASVFQIYPVTRHHSLGEDVLAAIATVDNWQEGLAMRTFVFANIALSNPSAMARTTYRILEGGQFTGGEGYATAAVASIAKGLAIGPQTLLKLYATNFIWNWMSSHTLDRFPYSCFGYGNFHDFCKDVQEELIAILVVKGMDDVAEGEVAVTLNMKYDELLYRSFPRVYAYGVAWAIGHSTTGPSVHVRLQKRLTEDRFYKLIYQYYPVIIAHYFEVLLEDGPCDSLLLKDASLSDACDRMKRIKELGYDQGKISEPALMPSFTPLVVVKSIYNTYVKSMDCDMESLWTPPVFTFVARRMLNQLHLAYGPAHACGVIRNLRLLVCLAGDTACSGYPLEMVMHGLKPFIADRDCADDTIGLLKYLFLQGRDHLKKRPEFSLGIFFSGLAVSRNTAPTRDDARTRLAQTSAEDHLKLMLGELLAWETDTVRRERFKALVTAGGKLIGRTDTSNGSRENVLLKLVLEDERSKEPLLDETSRKIAITLLGYGFTRPESFRDDAFGADELSIVEAESLMRICRRFNVNDNLLSWAARVLGRAYAASGHLAPEWTQEIEFKHGQHDIVEQGVDYATKEAIAQRILALLHSEDNAVITLAEEAIIRIGLDERANLPGQPDIFYYTLAEEIYPAFQWNVSPFMDFDVKKLSVGTIQSIKRPDELPYSKWIKNIAVTLTSVPPVDPLVASLRPLLETVDGLATDLLPYIIHTLLLNNMAFPTKDLHSNLSSLYRRHVRAIDESTAEHASILVNTILYLRTQERPSHGPKDRRSWGAEPNKRDRDSWLSINYLELSTAATICRKYKSALLFAEIHHISQGAQTVPSHLLLDIFKSIDDLDSFYGVQQQASLGTVLSSFEYEGDGWKSLSFRGADLESRQKLRMPLEENAVGVIQAFTTLGMNGLSHTFLQNEAASVESQATLDNMFRSAWKLEQWDLPCPSSCKTRSATVYRALQSINNNTDSRSIAMHLDQPMLDVMRQITAGETTTNRHALSEGLRTLAMMTEIEELLVSTSADALNEAWARLQARTAWMRTSHFSDVEELMTVRQVTLGSLDKQQHLRQRMNIDVQQSRFMEAKAVVESCKMARSHKVLQHALSSAQHLHNLVDRCEAIGVDIKAMATLQAAEVLWDHEETGVAIRMLKGMEGGAESEDMGVGKAKLLSTLGTWVAEARLEEPETIMKSYLERAIVELKGNAVGNEAGKVFHEFGMFCDYQTRNPALKEERDRAQRLRHKNKAEYDDLDNMLKKAKQRNDEQERRHLERARTKAKAWLVLDEEDHNRMSSNKDAFIEKALTNYLRSLAACDLHDTDAIRFCALWLEHSKDSDDQALWQKKTTSGKGSVAIASLVSIELEKVQSHKFIPLMNQLSSRLVESSTDFQKMLTKLVQRICREHPHHALYQILALNRLPENTPDSATQLRRQAAKKVLETLLQGRDTNNVYHKLLRSTECYHSLASIQKKREKSEVPSLQGILRGASSRKNDYWKDFDKFVLHSELPPPTMDIPVVPNGDYSNIPQLISIDDTIIVASGISAPKILTCRASDGRAFKLLVKGGNDDLRQDAIMEQVFELVSTLLQNSRITRQRDLKIRTYKVIPLTNSTGIIEFVPNTRPLLEWLEPAHKRYNPKDLSLSQCRKMVSDVQTRSREKRISAYQDVTKRYSPVMRYFFMHEFSGPDQWYASRLAYTRSTAANSILGWVLGLGDRHGHNILLDNKTGEVVHIDLGVAFEQGRVLPVPEVVPFRLTRDVVDGMGVTGVEGVFRRCCEFTLSVLKEEFYTIITILDVLRYDPLYSWTVSPVRAKKMQEDQFDESNAANAFPAMSTTAAVAAKEKGKEKEKEEEDTGLEADRALTVVHRKLSSALSVGATVNELIQQASDERNLALLYCGWAAWV